MLALFFRITALIVMLFLTAHSSASAMLKGVNYDPYHSFEFAKGIGMDDATQMKEAIEEDFDRLYQLHKQFPELKDVNHIKTFLPFYASSGLHGPVVKVDIAEVMNDWDQKHSDDPLYLAIGMWERDDTDSERASQINAIVNDVKKYNHNPNNNFILIDRIIVGSEDMQDWWVPGQIIKDVNDIRNQLQQDNTVKIGTAQIPVFANAIFDKHSAGNDVESIGDVVDFVGINPYPFWESQEYHSAFQNLAGTWNNFKNLVISHGKELIITEEGWPSDGGSHGAAIAYPPYENYYFVQYWNKRQEIDAPISYYFALFDKLPDLGIESHWGIFSADRTKSILDSDFSKPLDSEKKHILVNFENLTGQTIALYACLTDLGNLTYTSTINNQCYPIYGTQVVEGADFNVGDSHSRRFMLDISGNTYKSLVVYSGQERQPMCRIDSKTLRNFQNNQQVQIKKSSGFFDSIWFYECALN